MNAARNTFDAVIVGGGIIGLACAEELSRRGRSVVVVDRRAPGGEASWAAGGMLAADYEGALSAFAKTSRSMWPALCERIGAKPPRPQGTLVPARDAAAAAALREKLAGAEWLDAEPARAREPALGAVAGAAWLREDTVVDNREVLMRLLARLRERGVVLRSGFDARLEADCVAGGGERLSGRVVLAAGAWSSRVLPSLPPVEPVRGQMLVFRAAPDSLAHVVRHDELYAIPRGDGRIVVGATMEHAGFDKQVTPDAVESLTRAFHELLPALAGAPLVCAWAGLRPAAPDGLPLIGALDSGTIVATGHFRNGILLAPATAVAVADLVEGKAASVPIGAFHPTRPFSAIWVNGERRGVAPGTTVGALLAELVLRRQGVAVAINDSVLSRGEWDKTALRDQDRVEILHAVGGG